MSTPRKNIVFVGAMERSDWNSLSKKKTRHCRSRQVARQGLVWTDLIVTEV